MRMILNGTVLAAGLLTFSLGTALACGGSLQTAGSTSEEVASVKSLLQSTQTAEQTTEKDAR